MPRALILEVREIGIIRYNNSKIAIIRYKNYSYTKRTLQL